MADEANYTIPMSGYYNVRAKITKFEATGYYTYQKRHRKWCKFWEPTIVWAPEYKQIEVFEGSEVRFLNYGESVGYKFNARRIGGK
jgi:hypothetical protein